MSGIPEAKRSSLVPWVSKGLGFCGLIAGTKTKAGSGEPLYHEIEKDQRKKMDRVNSGKKVKDYKKSVNILFKSIGPQKRLLMRKENPILKQRNKILASLKSRGVSFPVLARASGLGLTSLYTIIKRVCDDENNCCGE